jgi:hypothetical protein
VRRGDTDREGGSIAKRACLIVFCAALSQGRSRPFAEPRSV